MIGVRVLSLMSVLVSVSGRGSQHVSCGSLTKLFNVYYQIRLHSHDVKYGSGSGQQSVTGTQGQEDHNSYWLVKGPPSAPCKRGEAVMCGQKIRFEHMPTKRNLHSHHFSSPLSDQQEISAFGEDGEGDTGDIWTVMCDDQHWNREQEVMFKHVDTDMYLSCTSNQYGRPISGQSEIVGTSYFGKQAKWKTMEGVFVQPAELLVPLKNLHDPSEL